VIDKLTKIDRVAMDIWTEQKLFLPLLPLSCECGIKTIKNIVFFLPKSDWKEIQDSLCCCHLSGEESFAAIKIGTGYIRRPVGNPFWDGTLIKRLFLCISKWDGFSCQPKTRNECRFPPVFGDICWGVREVRTRELSLLIVDLYMLFTCGWEVVRSVTGYDNHGPYPIDKLML
jgi:hypothetical protein